ncbi:hypothetical protein RQP46_005302 [Phenoliferia psychrophenolica]
MSSWLPKALAPAPPPAWYAPLLEPEHLPLIGYMSSIGLLLGLLSPSLSRALTRRSALYLVLALGSLGYTWYYMVMFFERSFVEAALRANVSARVFTTKAWLRDTSLFVEAWGRVCETAKRWWWSEQLCGWTAGPFTVFLERESRLRNIPRAWGFMLLGQIVAISVAQNLFFAAHSLALPGRTLASKPQGRTLAVPRASPPQNAGPSWLLCACVLASLSTVAYTPSTLNSPSFLVNLLVMHVLLILPLLPSIPSSTGPRISYAQLYLATAAIALLLRIPTYLSLLPSLSLANATNLARDAVKTLYEHPAQTSIGYDVVWASASFVVWMAVEFGRREHRTFGGLLAVIGLALATPVVGVAVSGGVFLAWRESWDAGRVKVD